MTEQAAVHLGDASMESVEPGRDFGRSILAIGTSAAEVLVLLNEVTAQKRDSILGLAMTGVGKSLKGEACAETAPSLEEAKKSAEETLAQLQGGGSATAIGLLEHAAAQAIAMAIQNTVTASQHLDVLGQAVLAMTVTKVGGR